MLYFSLSIHCFNLNFLAQKEFSLRIYSEIFSERVYLYHSEKY